MATKSGFMPLPVNLLLSLLLLSACSSDDRAIDEPVAGGQEVINTPVAASVGGEYSSSDGRIVISIPAGAMSEDSTLVVREAEGLGLTGGNMSSAGDAFSIDFGVALTTPVELVLNIHQAPVHPTLAESSAIENGQWVRQPANFFRTSDSSVLSFIDGNGTYQATYRTLQTEAGDSVNRGRAVFLDATFGNQDFFGGAIGLHELLNDLSPAAAVGVGVQVDVTRVPQPIVAVLTGDDFAAKQVALQNPAVTRALLKADAVVGVKTFYTDPESEFATSAGITCAVCHARVTPSSFELAQGESTDLPIGPLQLDGVPNTSMDVGTILSLTPFATAAGQPTVDFLRSFGAGRFDARSLPDNPLEDNLLNPTSIPQLWNFIDLDEQEYTYNWDGQFASVDSPNNALGSRAELVYDLVMHANGAFGTDAASVPIELSRAPSQDLIDALIAAEDQQPGNDIDQQSILDVQAWQRSIASPAPGEFDEALAETGFRLFNGHAQCSSCHATAEFTGPIRSADIVLQPPMGVLADGVKTPGLRGISHVPPYFHDDSAETLADVVDIYSGRIVNELSAEEKQAVVEYLKSL